MISLEIYFGRSPVNFPVGVSRTEGIRSSSRQMFVLECASVRVCECVCARSTRVSRINRLIAEMSVSVTG